jgi:hypothetical protein
MVDVVLVYNASPRNVPDSTDRYFVKEIVDDLETFEMILQGETSIRDLGFTLWQWMVTTVKDHDRKECHFTFT